MLGERKLIWLAVILAPLLVASLFWALYRNYAWSAGPAKAVTAAHSSTSSSISQIPGHADPSGSEGLSDAQSTLMFSVAPQTPAEPDPVASFRQLIAPPSDTARETLHIDPRRIRTIVDRGVVGYASAKTDEERAKGAGLIQTAALVGYSPARDLLVRNYPRSEAVRSVVPAKDVIRYALGPVIGAGAPTEDSKQVFLALGQHFAIQGQLDLFATQILSSLGGDSRPQLGYRIETLLDLLARIPGACGALARLVPGAGKAADPECSFSEDLRKHIERTAPAPEEEDSKRRGLFMLKQVGGR
jgi:hypothetical protein